jgi:hypothetical protein
MHAKTVLLSEAKQEILEVASSYDQLRPGLGDTILAEIQDKFGFIERHPHGYELVVGNMRRAILRTIPYQLFYAIEEHFIVILGVASARMEPQATTSELANRAEVVDSAQLDEQYWIARSDAVKTTGEWIGHDAVIERIAGKLREGE